MGSRIRFKSRNGTGFTNFASAIDIASSLSYNKFSEKDMKIIEAAYKKCKKRFQNSYSDSDDQGDDSSLSNDDNEGDSSMRSTVFNKDIPSHSSTKAPSTRSISSLLPKKGNPVHLKKKTSKNMLVPNIDNNLPNHSQVGDNVQPLQKSNFQNKYPLPSERFSKSIAAETRIEEISKKNLKTNQNTKSVDKGETSGLYFPKPSCLDRDKKSAETKQNSSEIKGNEIKSKTRTFWDTDSESDIEYLTLNIRKKIPESPKIDKENLKEKEELRNEQLAKSSASDNCSATHSDTLIKSNNRLNSLRVRSHRDPKKIISSAKSQILSNKGADTNIQLNSKDKDNSLAKNITNNIQREETEDIVVISSSPTRSVEQIGKNKQLDGKTGNVKSKIFTHTFWDADSESDVECLNIQKKFPESPKIDKENSKEKEKLRTEQLTKSSDSNNRSATQSDTLITSNNRLDSLRLRAHRALSKITFCVESQILSNDGADTNIQLNSKDKDNNLAKSITKNMQTEDTEDIVVDSSSPTRSVEQIGKNKPLDGKTGNVKSKIFTHTFWDADSESDVECLNIQKKFPESPKIDKENLKEKEEVRTEQLAKSSDSNNRNATHSDTLITSNNSLRIRPHRAPKKIISCAESQILSNEGAGTNIQLNSKDKDKNLAKNITNNIQTEDTEDIVVNSSSPTRSVEQIGKNKQLDGKTENLKEKEEVRTEQLAKSSDSNNCSAIHSDTLITSNNRLNSLRIRPHRAPKKIISCAESQILSNEGAGTNIQLNSKDKDKNLAKNITNNIQTEDTEDNVVNSSSRARSVAQIGKNKQSDAKTGKLTKTTTTATKTNKDSKSNEIDTSHSMQQSPSNNKTTTKKGQTKRNKVANKLVRESDISFSPLNMSERTRSRTRAITESKKHSSQKK